MQSHFGAVEDVVQPSEQACADEPVEEGPDRADPESSIGRVVPERYISKQVPPLVAPATTRRDSQDDNSTISQHAHRSVEFDLHQQLRELSGRDALKLMLRKAL